MWSVFAVFAVAAVFVAGALSADFVCDSSYHIIAWQQEWCRMG